MKTTEDVDLNLSFSSQINCSLGTKTARKRYIFNHIPATATGQPFREKRGAVNVLHIVLYFTGFKITDVNAKLSEKI